MPTRRLIQSVLSVAALVATCGLATGCQSAVNDAMSNDDPGDTAVENVGSSSPSVRSGVADLD